VTDPAAELDGKVAVNVAGISVDVVRPPFRRLKPLLRMSGLDALAALEVDDDGMVKGTVDLGLIIEFGEAAAEVLWPDEDERNGYLDMIMTGPQWGEFMSSVIDALQLGEAFALAASSTSTGTQPRPASPTEGSTSEPSSPTPPARLDA
jgi:hypothetical protein